jgi:NADPH:quinone reductase
MKAIVVEEFGGPEVLVARDLEMPKAKADEVVIRLAFAGINYIDTQMRAGSYKTSETYVTKLPMVLGQEGAGTVVEVGAKIKSFKPGDRVAYCFHLGSYAEYAAIPAYRVVKVPKEVALSDATVLMMQGLTAQYLAYSTSQLKEGETCLIHAAAGGVGQILIQLAKNRGATVLASVGSAEKAKLASECGADYTVLYRQMDFHKAVMQITGERGVDVVFDSVGKDTIDGSIHSTRKRGLCILYGGASGLVREINPQDLADAGSIFFTRPHLAHHITTAEEMQERADVLFDLLTTQKLKVRIFREFKLDEAVQAHQAMERGDTLGKMLLRMNGSAE